MARKVGQDMIVKKTLSSNRVPLRTTSRPAIQLTPNTVSEQKTKPIHNTIENRTSVQQSLNLKPTPPPVRPGEKKQYESRIKTVDYYDTPRPIFSDSDPKKTSVRGGTLWVFVGIAIIGLFFAVVSAISHTIVHLGLQKTMYPVDMDATLSLELSSGQIAFKTAQVNDRQTIVVPTTEKQTINASATGTVRLFSSSTKPVTIPAGTILISTAQKKFTTKSGVIIPKGTTARPGSVDVIITATTAGADANIKLDDLTLPNFPSVTARTITEITGGSSGEQPILSDAQLTDAKTSLQAMMKNNHPATFLAHQIPEHYWIPESLIQVSDIAYHTEPVETGVMVVAERTITGNMIDRTALQEFLLNTVVPESQRSYVNIVDTESLELKPAQPLVTNITQNKTLTIYLSGSFTGQAVVDESSLRQSIARKKKNAAITTLRAVPGVTSVSIRIWPPWITHVADKVSKISFITSYNPVP